MISQPDWTAERKDGEETAPKGRILVIRGGAIGDFILTLPALAALRNQFPEAHLEVLGYPHIAELAVASGTVHAVRSIEAGALAGFFARFGTLDNKLCDYFASFAVVISYLYDPDEIFQLNVRRCTSAQFIQGPHRPSDSGGIHATDVFLKPLERLAIFSADPVPRLHLSGTKARELQGRWLAVHPGSGSERKNWPAENWAALLRQLAELPFLSLLLVGGEAEAERLQQMESVWPASRFKVARNLPLPELGDYLAGCRFFIGHDSGITHLAAAVGLEGIALWGPSPIDVWRPMSDRITVIREPGGIASLGVEKVYQTVKERSLAWR